MEIITTLFDFFLHLDEYLGALITQFGPWMYIILFLIIFAETGLVVTPILPGDSLLFAAGALAAATGALNVYALVLILVVAAIAGDSANYAVGNYIGPRVFTEKVRFLKKEYLDKTHEFYEKYGGKTIILARFVPIVRTFAPFVAGVGSMTYGKFIGFNVIGALIWVPLFLLGGYFFGNLPIVAENFELVIIGIIIVSILPAVFEYLKERRNARGLTTWTDRR
ncbi:MAG: DedA family protein [Anaerolineales bacterium]